MLLSVTLRARRARCKGAPLEQVPTDEYIEKHISVFVFILSVTLRAPSHFVPFGPSGVTESEGFQTYKVLEGAVLGPLWG